MDDINNNPENEVKEEKTEENNQIPVDTQTYETNTESEPQNETTPPINEQENNYNYSSENQTFNTSEKSSYCPKINYSPVNPMDNNKQVSKGIKVFSILLAAVILLSGACLTGYLFDKNNVSTSHKNISVDLSAKPKKTDEMTPAEVYDSVNKSVVGITIYNTAGNGAQASGVIYSKDGYIVTNDHIYSEVPSPKFKIYSWDGKEYEAEYVAGDKVSDLAVLKLKSGSFKPADFGNSDELILGENVVAIGRPEDATSSSSITKGIISLTSKRVQNASSYSARLIQTDSAINPGSSGGALVNMYGQVIGITSSKLASVEYDAVGYAIPTTTVKRIVEELISKGKVVTRAKLGITYTAINSVTAEIKNYKYQGLYVASVAEDSDLYGKLQKGDIITQINGKDITDDDIVLDIIEQCKAGDKITITAVDGNGNSKTYNAVLKANTGESSYTTKATQKNPGSESGGNSSGNSSGGTFDFPFGE